MKQRGFTVIELIVIVVVIGLLAGISIFAFGNWRQTTSRTEVKVELNAAANALKNELNFKSQYPANQAGYNALEIPHNANVLPVVYTLRPGGASYCLKATSKVTASEVWYIDSLNGVEPSKTACT